MSDGDYRDVIFLNSINDKKRESAKLVDARAARK